MYIYVYEPIRSSYIKVAIVDYSFFSSVRCTGSVCTQSGHGRMRRRSFDPVAQIIIIIVASLL